MLQVLKDRFRDLDLLVKEIFTYRDRLLLLLSGIKKLTPVRWFIEYKEHIASCLYLLWLTGCVYWIYQLMIVDAQPSMDRIISVDDPRDAMVFIFFGTFGLLYISFFAAFTVKFIFNIVHGGILSLLSPRWYSMIKSIILLLCLNFAFLYVQHIKAAGLTAYTQIAELVHISRGHTAVVETDNAIDASRLLELLEKKSEE